MLKVGKNAIVYQSLLNRKYYHPVFKYIHLGFALLSAIVKGAVTGRIPFKVLAD